MSDRIEYLDIFRAVTMCMVVGIHATGYAGLDVTNDIDNFIVFLTRTMALQSFFFVDGYLNIFVQWVKERVNSIYKQGSKQHKKRGSPTGSELSGKRKVESIGEYCE